MKIKFLIITLLFSQNIFSQTPNPFLAIQFDSVLIYDFKSRGKIEHFSIIDEEGLLAPTVKKSAKLDTETSKKLTKVVGEYSSYGQSTATCFDPHLGIVYYKKGLAIAHITVCIDCNRLVSNLHLPAQEQGKQGEGDETYFTKKGMSSSFRKFLDTLLKKYNFSHQVEPGSAFD